MEERLRAEAAGIGEGRSPTAECRSRYSLPTRRPFRRSANPLLSISPSVSSVSSVSSSGRYDFALFGNLSDIISDVFFPPQSGHTALIKTFAVFGLAFLARPIGGAIIGRFGDRYGRKKALEVSIFLMAFPTFLMGCLPGYDRIGKWAIVLLVVTRVLQGASVGGQMMSSAVFQIESQPDRARWGETGAWVMGTANLGSLLGGMVSELLRDSFSEDELRRYGWRIPFLSGVVVAFAGLYLRKYEEETEETHESKSHTSSSSSSSSSPNLSASAPLPNPIKSALTTYRRQTFIIALVTGGWVCSFYVGFIWLPIYMATLLDPPVPHAFLVSSASMFFGLFVFFGAAGSLSDAYGRRPVMLAGALGTALFAPVHLHLISGYLDPWLSCASSTFFGLLLSLLGAPANAFFFELVPREARLTTLALGYNIAQPFAGGMAPALATIFYDVGGPVFPSAVVALFSLLSFVGIWISPGTEAEAAFYARLGWTGWPCRGGRKGGEGEAAEREENGLMAMGEERSDRRTASVTSEDDGCL